MRAARGHDQAWLPGRNRRRDQRAPGVPPDVRTRFAFHRFDRARAAGSLTFGGPAAQAVRPELGGTPAAVTPVVPGTTPVTPGESFNPGPGPLPGLLNNGRGMHRAGNPHPRPAAGRYEEVGDARQQVGRIEKVATQQDPETFNRAR